jgi:Flp pilus assembly protein TadB
MNTKSPFAHDDRPNQTLARLSRAGLRRCTLISASGLAFAGLLAGLWLSLETAGRLSLVAMAGGVLAGVGLVRSRRQRRLERLATNLFALEHHARALRLIGAPVDAEAVLYHLAAAVRCGAGDWSVERALRGDAPNYID